MKNQPITLETEVGEQRAFVHPLGVAFNNANMVKTMPVELRPEPAVFLVPKANTGLWASVANFFKPAFSNLFLLGCLLGLFVLYCLSCFVHGLTLPVRRKSVSAPNQADLPAR